VIRTDEPQESVEDPFGLQRPADSATDPDPVGLGDSLAELPEARVVRTPDRVREVLRAGDESLRGSPRLPAPASPAALAYPEWDYRAGVYRRPGAVIHRQTGQQGLLEWVDSTAAQHARLIRRVRTRFEGLRPRRTRLDRQADGSEIDIAAFVTAAADLRAGRNGDDRLYVAARPARRELAVALLADVSASTDSWVDGRQRIVDVEKAALLVVCEALDALGDRHAIFAFSGEGPEHVTVVEAKTFADRLDTRVRRRIAALDADGYTRLGAAIRHATAALREERVGRRLLLILSDGKPNDVDAYEGQYGVEDTRQAVAESRSQDVHVFCLTVDREAPRYAPRIFGAAGFTLLRRPDQLPAVLIEVLRRLIRG
jgi:nitric oxide reductase NorD protein